MGVIRRNVILHKYTRVSAQTQTLQSKTTNVQL